MAFGADLIGPRRKFVVGVTRLSQLTLSLASSSNDFGCFTDLTLKWIQHIEGMFTLWGRISNIFHRVW